MLTILVAGSAILHKGIPLEDTPTKIIYEDIIYPKQIMGGYTFQEVDAPEDIDINLYYFTGTGIALIPTPEDNPEIPV